MRKIAIRTKKGGVGKTTTAGNIGYWLAQQGKTVCLVDVDSQYNLSTMFGIKQTSIKGTLKDILGGADFVDVKIEVKKNLFLIPANDKVNHCKRELQEVLEQLSLRKRLGDFSGFDFLIFDCPPGTNILTDNVICYIDEVWSPLQTEFFSFDGIEQILKELRFFEENFGPHGVHPRLTAVIPTLFDKRLGIALEVLDAARKRYSEIVTNPIRLSVKLSESPSFSQTIFEYNPKGKGVEDYSELGKRLLYGNKEKQVR